MARRHPITRTLFGRKLLLLFVFAALVPVSLAAIVSYLQVQGSLREQSTQDLRQDARNYGLIVLEKMTFADTILGAALSPPSGPDADFQVRSDLSFWFSFVAVSAPNGDFELLQGAAPAADIRRMAAAVNLEPGSTSVISHSDRHRRGHVLLIRKVTGSPGREQLLVAELNPEFLWGDRSAFPPNVDFCAVSDAGIALNCSVPAPIAVTGLLASFSEAASVDAMNWEMGGESFLGVGWHLFLQSRFATENWSILAFKPQKAAYAALAGFDNLYLKIALLSVLVVCFASSRQIRKSLEPLEALVEGTRRLSGRDFSQPIAVQSKDEFHGLATAMNQMGSSLKSKFQALELLSRMDQIILSSNSLAEVIKEIHRGLPDITGCEYVAVGIRDEDASDFILIDVHNAGEPNHSDHLRLPLDDETAAFLESASAAVPCPEAPGPNALSRQLFPRATGSVLFAPITSGGELKGFIALAFEVGAAGAEDAAAPVGEVADRVAVALSAADQEQHLYRQAHFDVLTGLPNRQLFHDRLQQEIGHARRDNRLGAVMFIDLDNFKRLNDSLGHSVGDELLKAAATRLRRCVRDDDTVARLGGDEFTVMVSGIPNATHAGNIADNILEAFARPFELTNGEHLVTASIGLTLFPDDGTNVERLLKNADTAMYRAKSEGRARRAFFEDSMHIEAVRRLEIEGDLRKALESGDQFTIHYQPQINAAKEEISGAEALIRWRHPEKGLIRPDEFIPVAEDGGLIHDLGLWVLRKSVEAFRRWEDKGRDVGRICVNVSTRQFQQSTFASCVRTILLECGMHPSKLELEITESLLADERDAILRNLAEIQSMGVRLAIDDFGTGYSSLSYMRRFDFDTLKIDRAFVTDLPKSEEISGITTAIVQMAHALGKSVVAEGVEHLEQHEFLKSIGCDEEQGYYFSKPLSEPEFEAFVDEFGSPEQQQSKTA